MATPDTAPQEDIDKVRTLIQNRILDIKDFFDTGDFIETCSYGDLELFRELLGPLEEFADTYNLTGNVGKVLD